MYNNKGVQLSIACPTTLSIPTSALSESGTEGIISDHPLGWTPLDNDAAKVAYSYTIDIKLCN